MKKFYVLLLAASSISILGACGSSGTSRSNSPDANANKVTVIDINDPSKINVNASENPIPANFDPTNGNRNANRVKMEASKRLSSPAADNSEIFTELNEIPIETRVFKDHPNLVKIVKSGIPPKQTVKVYLKGGKVMDLPGEKIPNLAGEPAANILTMLGIQAPQQPANPNRDAAKKAATEKKTQADQ